MMIRTDIVDTFKFKDEDDISRHCQLAFQIGLHYENQELNGVGTIIFHPSQDETWDKVGTDYNSHRRDGDWYFSDFGPWRVLKDEHIAPDTCIMKYKIEIDPVRITYK